MPIDALRRKFEAVLREFYSLADAEKLANLHAEWHDKFLSRLKSNDITLMQVEQKGATLAKKLAYLRRRERVDVSRQQREAIGQEVVEFLGSVAPELASLRQILSACSITGCSRSQIESVVRAMLAKGVIGADQPDSFYAKSYKLLTFEERVAFLAQRTKEPVTFDDFEREGEEEEPHPAR